MSITQIIEVIVGLALIYYILGLFVSYFSGLFLDIFDTRHKDLRDNLRMIIGNEATLGNLLGQPQIEGLRQRRYWLGIIPGKQLAQVEKIPVANFVDAFFGVVKLTKPENVDSAGIELKTQLEAVLGKDTQAYRDMAALIDQGVTDIDTLRSKAAMWATGIMNQVAAEYKSHARQFVIVISLIVTLVIGVDSIDLWNQLSHSDELRALADAKATLVVTQQPTADVHSLTQQLSDLSLRMTWVQTGLPTPEHWPVKILGLVITFLAVSLGSSFWYDVLRQLKGENAGPSEESTASSSS